MHAAVAFIFLSAATRFATSEDFVNVECKDETVGLVGQRTVLDCRLVLSAGLSGVKIRVIDWKRRQEKPPVVIYYAGEKTVIPGYDLAEPSWHNQSFNVSLLISNTTVADGGEYTYVVSTDSGNSKGKTSLRVKAEYSPPEIHTDPAELVRGGNRKLICESGGGYPKGVLRWFDGSGVEWTARATAEVNQTENGLFRLRSKFPLLPGSHDKKYTCVVFNASGAKESEVTFDPSPSRRDVLEQRDGNGTNPTNIAAPIIVIGSLAVGLLLVLVLLNKRKARLARRPSTRPLMNHPHEVPGDELNAEEGDQKMDV